MDTIYILDAVNYLFRSYYAIGPMTNQKGNSTSGLYGFIRSVEKVLKTYSPDHIVAVFDGPDNAKKRQEVYADYKMHRKKAPEDLYPQIGWAREFCEMAGIPTLCISGYEADDVMASVALWAKEKNAKSFLCTSDKDLFQIVGPDISVINIHKDNLLIDPKKVEEIFGVKPSQMLDLLAIMGDTADNIPGLSGFGPKTAASLLQKFGTLDAILENPEKVPGKKKQETLVEEREKALFSRELATLHQVDIPSSFAFYKKTSPNLNELKEFYQEMHFMTLLKELGFEKEKKEIPQKTSYKKITSIKELKTLLKSFEKKPVAFDLETTSLDPLQAEIIGIGLSAKVGEAYYIPFNGGLKPEELFQECKPFFERKNSYFIAHNAKYDYHVLFNHEIKIQEIGFDTMIASYLLYPHRKRHGLDALALEFFDKKKIPFSSLFEGKKKLFSEVPIDLATTYCCEDVDYTFRLYELFAKKIEENELKTLLEKMEMPLISILAKMERNGIYLDQQRLKEQGAFLDEKLQEIKKSIFQEAKETFNLNSPKQLSEVLFEKLKLPKPAKAKTATATGAKILETLALDYPIAEKILEFRTLDKLLSTYILALPKAIDPKTKRIHCTFNQSVVSTGRLSSQDPNLQNIPIRSEEGKKIRSAFRPEKSDWFYLSADYSQIELRLLAHLSSDEELIQAFSKGEDIHSYTASLVYEVPLDKVTKDMRRSAKAVNFGILYGQTPFGLSQELKIPRKNAKEFIDTYFVRYPKVSSYIQNSIEDAKSKGFALTITGRKRPLPEMHNKNPIIQKAAERLAVNTPLQGSAADLIKCAMITIDKVLQKKGLKSMMVLQVHDELIFEVPKNELEEMKILVKKEMEQAGSLQVPLVVDISIGKNWSEC